MTNADWAVVHEAHRKWLADGKNKDFVCPVEGGSIRGWTSI